MDSLSLEDLRSFLSGQNDVAWAPLIALGLKPFEISLNMYMYMCIYDIYMTYMLMYMSNAHVHVLDG